MTDANRQGAELDTQVLASNGKGLANQAEIESVVANILVELKDIPGPLLPILHEVQKQLGYVPDSSLPIIGKALNISRAEVHGVVSFYHHFSSKPRGRHIIEVCRAESCQSVGGRDLESHAKAALGLDWYQTSLDKEITLEPVFCLGNCACSPAIRIGEEVYGRMDAEQFDEILDELRTVPLAFSANPTEVK